MKGVILAGGSATRLYPLTYTQNKHLLPVNDRPMAYYAVELMSNCDIKDVMIITSREYAGNFLYHFRSGRKFGLNSLEYEIQEKAGGIAEALGLAHSFAGDSPVAVLLCDNIFEYKLAEPFAAFKKDPTGARIMLAEVDHPEHYGVPKFDDQGKITEIIEKPGKLDKRFSGPPSPYAVTGCYLYDNSVFDIVSRLTPSERGELEITDVNNAYIKKGQLYHSIVPGGWWDAGESIAHYNDVCQIVRERGANKDPLA